MTRLVDAVSHHHLLGLAHGHTLVTVAPGVSHLSILTQQVLFLTLQSVQSSVDHLLSRLRLRLSLQIHMKLGVEELRVSEILLYCSFYIQLSKYIYQSDGRVLPLSLLANMIYIVLLSLLCELHLPT